MSEETKKQEDTEVIETSEESEKEEERKEWGSPEQELTVLENPEFRFQIADKKLVLRPIKLKQLREILADVFSVLASLSEQQEVLKKAFESKGAGKLDPALILLLDSIADSFSRITASLLNVEEEWLEENLTIGHLGPIFFHFIEQNNIGLLIENFQKAASQIQGA